MNFVRTFSAALLAISVAACASPQSLRPDITADALKHEEHQQSLYVLERRASQHTRVYNIVDRLTRANAEFCPHTLPSLGFIVENIYSYASELRPAARELWGVSEEISIAWVGEHSPAARAGLRVRDRVVAINGREIGARRSVRSFHTATNDASEAGDVTLRINRGGEIIDLTMTPEPDCAYQFVIVDDDERNAFADGRTIHFYRGMMRFTESDEEIALIIGHELAHNAMGHVQASNRNATMGRIGGLLLDAAALSVGVNTGGAFGDAGREIGDAMYSQEFEAEADYVGMYFMARAGYSVDGVEEFWRRMSAENPQTIRLATTHPSHASRFVGLAATRQEIAEAIAAGAPLRPRMRGDETLLPTAATAPGRD